MLHLTSIEEAFDGENDEDIPVELSILAVTRVEKLDLPTGYKSVGDGTV